MKLLSRVIVAALALTALPYGLKACAATDSTEVPWDHSFPGHEMWLTSLDSGLAISASEHRPMLMDFYSRL
jgi:hypothetical protein